MAKFIARDVSVTINSVNLSDHVKSVKIDEKWDDIDVTGMGASAKQHLLGIADASIEVEFFQDFAAASVEATLAALKGSNTPFPIVVKPTSASVGPTNPTYTMQAILPEYGTIDSGVGDASTIKVKFMNGDQTGIVKATA
jgi:hypothetical protein